jgi:hypothetical protein
MVGISPLYVGHIFFNWRQKGFGDRNHECIILNAEELNELKKMEMASLSI